MKHRDLTNSGADERGQVLAIFALMVVVLFGFAALAIDVTRAYADLRHYRAVADSASLAGAQDLQTPGTRAVNLADYPKARQHALDSAATQLGGSATCSVGTGTTPVIDCPVAGTPYLVSVWSPSPSCSSCDVNRSVQVQVRNPEYGLSFARVFGQDEWNVGVTSVSGLVYGSQYAVLTLRPPKRLGATFDVKDIVLDGTGTTLTVQNGDIGSNANMELNGSGAAVNLDPGFSVFHFDGPPLWTAPPPGQKINTLIQDPNYGYPSFVGAPVHNNANAARTRASSDPSCAAEAAKVDPTRYTFMAGANPADIYCYPPGIYDSGGNNARIRDGTGEISILRPGVYYLKKGLDIGSHLVGGYEAGQPGVALVFDECNNVQCNFKGNNALTIALNSGTAFPPGTAGTFATPAVDYAGNQVITRGPNSPNPPILMTLLVLKDTSCFVPTSPPWQEPAGCNANDNQTIEMAGGGSLALVGVQYMPTDNVKITGGSSGIGEVGQIVSWTLTYSGGTRINQEYAGNTGSGTLRVDAACSAPGEPCNQ